MTGELEQIDGIARVQAVRNARIIYRHTRDDRGDRYESLSQTVHPRRSRRPCHDVAGDQGRGLMLSDNLAEPSAGVGDVVEIRAAGRHQAAGRGVVVDIDQQGTILMDRSVFQQYWRDDSINVFRVYLKPDATVPDVKARILSTYAGERQVFVLTNRELKDYILRVTDQWFSLSSVQIAVAVLVAILGIVNTLTVSITDRRRELGVLQAVGGLRAQIRRTIWMEALTTARSVHPRPRSGGEPYTSCRSSVTTSRDAARLRVPVTVALYLVPTMLGVAFVAAIRRSLMCVLAVEH
jgi:hypothetical protein